MTHVGQRMAAERKLAGLTQRQLAQRARYSLPLIKAVEQGREPGSPGLISAVARALCITPDLLTGAPYDDGKPLADAVNELRILLTEGKYVRATDPDPLEQLEAEIFEAQRIYRADHTRQTIEILPDLIRRVHGAVRDLRGDEQAHAYASLTYAYGLAEGCARRTGYQTLTLPALDLADTYAAYSDDPYAGAFSALARARLLTFYGESQVAGHLIDTAINSADSSHTGMVLAGYSHLVAAVNDARQLNHARADDHVQAAREFARQTGESDLYLTWFGPLNVEIHAHAIELESGDPNKAAVEGAKLAYGKEASPTRVAHHWQDNARAWLMSGKADKALVALNKARAAAPQQTRLHPSVRETVYAIAQAERRRTESLLGFASWVGTTL
ncbi:helix-turn-helix domain-containing protein [Nocardia terpenica]|uniref:helix-turn-helix domain-containing protein n=1 Tax=Nocardia terpenica TaxID=455432 RepID=UPI002FE38001